MLGKGQVRINNTSSLYIFGSTGDARMLLRRPGYCKASWSPESLEINPGIANNIIYILHLTV